MVSKMIRRLFVLFLLLIFLSTLLLRHIIQSLNEYDLKQEFIHLEDILKAKVQPKNGQNIFFIDTVRMKRRNAERPFTARQACAIESAGELNLYLLSNVE